MTRHLDPDRSQPPRFWPFPIDIDTSVCSRCSSMVPATDKAQETHRDHHRRVDALEAAVATVALTHQLSGPGSRGDTSVGWHRADASPGSASTSGARRQGPSDEGPTFDAHDRAPDPNVPTPPQDDLQGRGGVEDANQDSQPTDAGPSLLPGVAQVPDAPTSPGGSSGAALVSREEMLREWEPLAESVPEELGGTNRAGRGSGDPGEHHGSAPAGTNVRHHPAYFNPTSDEAESPQ